MNLLMSEHRRFIFTGPRLTPRKPFGGGHGHEGSMATPWLVLNAPASYEDQFWGYVMVSEERPGFYWTGSQGDVAWSANPRRALVDSIAPWDIFGSPVKGGRCVKVLLESEVTMLPLHKWPRPRD